MGVLSGKIVAITVSSKDHGSAEFRRLKAAVRENGGVYSPTVHKRVNVLLASSAAAAGRTQRIRKAGRFKVRVEPPRFIEACRQAGRWLAVGDVAWSASNENATAEAKSEEPRVRPPIMESTAESPEHDNVDPATEVKEVVWSGCYCACHDDGAPFCDWCIEGHPEAEGTISTRSSTTRSSATKFFTETKSLLLGQGSTCSSRTGFIAALKKAAQQRFWQGECVESVSSVRHTAGS